MADVPKKHPFQDRELEYVQSQQDTILNEEFPEGPYGASAYPHETKLGKTSEWKENQHVTSAHRDENPAFTDRLATPPNAELPDLT